MNKKNILLLVISLIVIIGVIFYDSYLIFGKKGDNQKVESSAVDLSTYEKKFNEIDISLKNGDIESFINSTNTSYLNEPFIGTIFDNKENLEMFKLNYTLSSIFKEDEKEHTFLLDKFTIEKKVLSIFTSFSFDNLPSSFNLNYNGFVGSCICEELKCMISYKKGDKEEKTTNYYTKVTDTKTNGNKIYTIKAAYVEYVYDSEGNIIRTLLKEGKTKEEVLYEGNGRLEIESFDDILNYVGEDSLPTYEARFTSDNHYHRTVLIDPITEE